MLYIDTKVINSERQKCPKSTNHDTSSHKTDLTSSGSGTVSNLANFRIPRKQNHANDNSNSTAVDPRRERRKVNVGPGTLLKPDTRNHSNIKANAVAAACPTDVSSHNSSMFRIPRKQNHANDNSNRTSVDPRREGMKVNFGPDTFLKPHTQNQFNSKATAAAAAAAACATDVCSQNLGARKCVKRGWNETVTPIHKPDTLHSTSGRNTSLNNDHSKYHTSNNITVAVHEQSVKTGSDSSSNVHVKTGKQWPRSSAVFDGGKVSQLDSPKLTCKLPEELVRAGWKLCWSKQRSRWYIFNVRTGSSSWDVPK